VAFGAKDVAGFKARFLEVLDRVGKISCVIYLHPRNRIGVVTTREAGIELVTAAESAPAHAMQ